MKTSNRVKFFPIVVLMVLFFSIGVARGENVNIPSPDLHLFKGLPFGSSIDEAQVAVEQALGFSFELAEQKDEIFLELSAAPDDYSFLGMPVNQISLIFINSELGYGLLNIGIQFDLANDQNITCYANLFSLIADLYGEPSYGSLLCVPSLESVGVSYFDPPISNGKIDTTTLEEAVNESAMILTNAAFGNVQLNLNSVYGTQNVFLIYSSEEYQEENVNSNGYYGAVARETKGRTILQFQHNMAQTDEQYMALQESSIFKPIWSIDDAQFPVTMVGQIDAMKCMVFSFEESEIIETAMLYCPKSLEEDAYRLYRAGFVCATISEENLLERNKNYTSLSLSLMDGKQIDANGKVYYYADNEDYVTYRTPYNGGNLYTHINKASNQTYDEAYATAVEIFGAESTPNTTFAPIAPTAEPIANPIKAILHDGKYDCPADVSPCEYRISPTTSAFVKVYRDGECVLNTYLQKDREAISSETFTFENGDRIEVSGMKVYFAPIQ